MHAGYRGDIHVYMCTCEVTCVSCLVPSVAVVVPYFSSANYLTNELNGALQLSVFSACTKPASIRLKSGTAICKRLVVYIVRDIITLMHSFRFAPQHYLCNVVCAL